MHNYFKNKCKKGDISILVTLLVCSIILTLLTPIAQKISVESKISRENLMSQQAVQASKTGLEAWNDNFIKDKIDEKSTGNQKNWPNFNTPIGEIDSGWINLDPTLGIQYKVEFLPKSEFNSARIISTGRVKKGSFTIERSLEETFDSLEDPCSTPVSFSGVSSRYPFSGGWGKQVFVLDRSVGITAPWNAFMLDNAISFRVSNASNAVDSASTTFFAPGTGNYTVTSASDNSPTDGSTGNGNQSSLTIDGKQANIGSINNPIETSIYIDGPKIVTINMTIGNGIEGGNDFLANPMGMAFTITANNLTTCIK